MDVEVSTQCFAARESITQSMKVNIFLLTAMSVAAHTWRQRIAWEVLFACLSIGMRSISYEKKSELRHIRLRARYAVG
ncbi:MAG TPA: hypothetical protein VK550_23420 [Polyangiaceae bacterium]|nr:hypothetical protein [Polyangiaceae bacterium]